MADLAGAKNYAVADLRNFTLRVFTALGVPEDDATIVANSLIEANLRGVDTHGITRLLGIYVRRLQAGIVNKDGRIAVERDGPSSLLVDGRNCLGAVVAHKTMSLCLDKAAQTGACWAGIHDSNHCGALAYWAMKALERGMIGVAFTNGPASMAPWGGAEAYLSTNPVCFAIPSGQEPPIVLDMATSAVSRGRIILAASRGEKIPLGWAVDRQGRPTDDAAEGVKGFVMPLGGYKGYGLSLVVDILCGALTGAAFGPHIGSLYEEFSRGQNVGTMLGAIDVGHFLPVDFFKERVDQEIREIKACRLAEGSERIWLPGEMELLKKEQRLQEGIPMDDVRIEEFTRIGDELGVPFPQL
jgi:LDH2 family malate/lactate/ureidoglycolate dehydrogenase